MCVRVRVCIWAVGVGFQPWEKQEQKQIHIQNSKQLSSAPRLGKASSLPQRQATEGCLQGIYSNNKIDQLFITTTSWQFWLKTLLPNILSNSFKSHVILNSRLLFNFSSIRKLQIQTYSLPLINLLHSTQKLIQRTHSYKASPNTHGDAATRFKNKFTEFRIIWAQICKWGEFLWSLTKLHKTQK